MYEIRGVFFYSKTSNYLLISPAFHFYLVGLFFPVSFVQEKMAKLQVYYTKAIRTHADDKEKMQRAIMATFNHCTSTDVWPKHWDCPEGKDSWCFYNRASANEETPLSHDNPKFQTCFLNKKVVLKLRPIYERLS